MDSEPRTKPVEDTVPKIDGSLAVGEDLEFQRKWWRFERVIWTVFLAIILCDVLGMFGKGWLSKAVRVSPDQAMTLNFERIERANTPSSMTLTFGTSAIHGGRIRVFVSDSVVRLLGAQRISPQPLDSTIGGGGITYTFPATQGPAAVEIMLQPSFPGRHSLRIQSLGSTSIDESIFVVP